MFSCGIRCSMLTDHPERIFDDESTISGSPEPRNTATLQDHSSTRAKFDRTRAWEVLGFWGVTKVTSSERHTPPPPPNRQTNVAEPRPLVVHDPHSQSVRPREAESELVVVVVVEHMIF